MLAALTIRTYRHLFAAQVLSLIGTGLTTVALGLLAYDLAGANAGMVLGTALALKMVAYVAVAPVAAALAANLPRRGFLVSLDIARAGMVLFLPFVTEIWQIYLLVFAFQVGSAAFTPSFQATIPEVVTDDAQYAQALTLSRLAGDLEALVSPLLAGLLLTVISFHWLFIGTALGFLASAGLILSVVLPLTRAAAGGARFAQRVTRGLWIYLATPRLRGLLALHFAAAAAGAMVYVNTVIHVRDRLAGSDADVAVYLAVFGAGSITAALTLPRLLAAAGPRAVMLAGAGLLVAVLALAGFGFGYGAGLVLWAAIGAGSALIETPAGLLLRRSSHPEDGPALFAADFALSHGCWLITYPAAGWLGLRFGLDSAFLVLALSALASVALALRLWPRHDPDAIAHVHDHPAGTHAAGAPEVPLHHSHAFVIDDQHPVWPDPTRSGH